MNIRPGSHWFGVAVAGIALAACAWAPVLAQNTTGTLRGIVSGSNGGFSAHAGYDNTTGIGSIKGFKFAGVE